MCFSVWFCLTFSLWWKHLSSCFRVFVPRRSDNFVWVHGGSSEGRMGHEPAEVGRQRHGLGHPELWEITLRRHWMSFLLLFEADTEVLSCHVQLPVIWSWSSVHGDGSARISPAGPKVRVLAVCLWSVWASSQTHQTENIYCTCSTGGYCVFTLIIVEDSRFNRKVKNAQSLNISKNQPTLYLCDLTCYNEA